jgi:hypothetical protein
VAAIADSGDLPVPRPQSKDFWMKSYRYRLQRNEFAVRWRSRDNRPQRGEGGVALPGIRFEMSHYAKELGSPGVSPFLDCYLLSAFFEPPAGRSSASTMSAWIEINRRRARR